MKQSTIKRARELGFTITDRLEQYVSDYTLKLNEDTFEETERWSTKKQYFWNVTFPPDYLSRHPRAVYDDDGLLALIRLYEDRFESAKRDAEFSRRAEEAMHKFRERFKL